MSSIFSLSRLSAPAINSMPAAEDPTIAEKVLRAVGSTLSTLGQFAFMAGITVLAIVAVPYALGAPAALLTYPAYMTIAGFASCLAGELAKHWSGRQIVHVSVS